MPSLSLTEIELEAAIAPPPPLVTPETSVREAIALMSAARASCSLSAEESAKTKTGCVLVVKENHLLGIFTERDVVRLSTQGGPLGEIAIAEVMTHPVVTLRRSEFIDIFSALNLLQVHHLRHLPLLEEDDHLIGILTHESLRQLLRPLDLLRLRLASEVMTSQVIWAEPHASMVRVAQLMAEHRVSCVVIGNLERGGNGKPPLLPLPVGIVTEGDIVGFQALGLDFTRVTAQTVMSTPPFAVHPDDSLWTVQRLMQQRQVRRMVVTGDRGELLGIVTQTSLLQSLNPLELYQLVESLEAKVSRLEAEKRAWLETRNVELEQEVQARTAQLQAQVKGEQLLAAIANRIRSSLNWQEILDKTVSEVRSLLGCDRVAIWQFQPDGSAVAVAEAGQQPWFLARQVKDACFTTNRLMEYSNERIRVVPDIHTTEMSDCHREFLEQLQIRAKILVPIVQGETLWGMLSAIESQAPRQWQTEETALLQQLATQLAIALQQAAAYQQAETELAERRRVEAALQWQIEFDRLIAHISNRFIQLSYPELSDGINHALQQMGEFLQVDASYVFQYTEDRQTADLTYEWMAEGLPPQRDNRQNFSCEAFPWANARICQGEIVAVSSLDNLPPEAAIDRQAGQDFGVKSAFSVPLRDRDQIIGFVGFVSLGREHIWAENTVQSLQIFSEILTYVIQRQHAETELQASEQRYASLAEVAPVGIFRSDPQGNCLYVNDRWCQMTGLPAAASLGTGWAASIHPGDRDQLVSQWQRFVQENSTFRQEFRVQHSHGQIYWVFGQAVAEYDAKGQIIGYIGTLTDISERKAAEAALREQDRRFEGIISSIDGVVWSCNAETLELIHLSSTVETIYGRSVSEFLANPNLWFGVIHPQDQAAVASGIEELRQTGRKILEYRIIRGDGQVRWLQDNCHLVCDIEGQPCHIDGIAMDITILRTAQDCLRNNEERLRLALAASSQGLYDLNIQTGEAIVNDEYALMLGYEPAEFQETNAKWIERLHPDDREPVAATYRAYINQEIPEYRVEFRQRTKTGDWKWILSLGKITTWDGEGNPLRMLGTHTDISDGKQAEQQLQETRNFLQIVIDYLPVAVFVKDGREEHFGEFRLWNRTSELMFGLTAKQAIGKTVHDYFPQEQADFFYQKDRKAFERGVPEDIPEEQIDSHSLGRRTLHTVKVPIYDDSQAPKYLLCFSEDITERKLAEKALQDSENRLSNLIANLPGYVYRVANDLNYTPEFVSEGVYKITGYRQEEYLLARTISCGQEIHPDDAEVVWNLVQQALEGKQPYECEYRIITKSGETKWVWERGGGCWTESGELLFLEGFVTDISERKRAEGELLRKNAEMQAIFAAFPDLFFRMTADGTIRDYKAKNASDLYLPPEFFLNKRMQEVLPPAVAEQISAAIAQVLQTKSLVYIEYSLPMSNQKSPFDSTQDEHFEARLVPLWEDQVVAIIRNISERQAALRERKRGEEELRQLNERLEEEVARRTAELETLFNTLPDYIFVVDRQGKRITFCNDIFAQGIGFAHRQQVQGKAISECFSDERVEYFAQQNQQVFSSGETLHLEETIILSSGIHHFDTYKVPLKNSQGEVYALLGASRDITELIKTQQALSERTVQLEVLNKELDSFSYSVSHDLRAPLRHVNGFVNALRQRLEINNALNDPKVTHYLQVIEDSSQKMGDLIDGLLTLSRLGRRELVFAPVDLQQLVENVINLLSSSLEIKQLSATEFRVGNLPQVKGDMTLLQQVFTNLIGNAIKFSQGRLPATIEIDSQPDGTIFVKDNGVGFSPQYADQLFGAFQRLHSKQQFEGTGIGLSIVQRIIHRHGGQIWAESAPDEGATFYFTLGKQPLRIDEHGS